MSILESSRRELRIVHGLTLMTPSPRGWETFPTPGALTHTRINWAFSSSAPHVPGVTPGSPLCPWCFGHPFGEVRDMYSFNYFNEHVKYQSCATKNLQLFTPLEREEIYHTYIQETPKTKITLIRLRNPGYYPHYGNYIGEVLLAW